MKHFLSETINNNPCISREEERYLFERLKADPNDDKALVRLFNSHLRLVFSISRKVARSARREQIRECIAAGRLGLLIAIKKFDTDNGARLTTHAAWWIRSEIYDYVRKNTSLVKVGTTVGQKKVFYGLRKARHQIGADTKEFLESEDITAVANLLDVTEEDVSSVVLRMGGDWSLNTQAIKKDEPDSAELLDFLASPDESPETIIIDVQEQNYRKGLIVQALEELKDRERHIFTQRQLLDPDDRPTLDTLAKQYGVSRERIRQIEHRAFKRVQKIVRALDTDNSIRATGV